MTSAKKILIAEDEKPLARALSIKLKNVGIDADIAYDGDMVKDFMAKNEYSLILTDLMMPRHDSFGFIEGLKASGNKTPIAVMSNLSQDTDRDRALRSGASRYFIKSDVQLADIVAYVQETLA